MEGVGFVGVVFLFWVVTGQTSYKVLVAFQRRKISGVPVLNVAGNRISTETDYRLQVYL